MQRQNIDSGNAFDWGKTSQDYGKFRDIYPPLFYQKIVERNCGTAGQEVLDIGTGTGVLPRNMYRFGAHWTGSDIAPNQIAEAKRLSAGMESPILFRRRRNWTLPKSSLTALLPVSATGTLTIKKRLRYLQGF